MDRTGSFDSLDDWLRWLETLSPREIDLGLERVEIVLRRLTLERPGLVVTVAGTNGKGSTVTMLDALLRESGARVGSYTSPHIEDYNERIRVDGRAVDDDEIIAALRRVEAVRDGVPLTYFEFGTLAALAVFEARRVDTIVLEVGLGGRLDAVNAVDPDGCIITNVTLDHCDWLGTDVESIAAEKAGIMRPGIPVVFGSTEVPRAIVETADRLGAELILAGRDFRVETGHGETWSWAGRESRRDGLARPSLAGRHQLDNAAAALALLEALPRTPLPGKECIDRAFGRLDLSGRLQTVHADDRTWVFDVAHNPDGARVLSAALPPLAHGGRIHAVVGVLADKDVDGIIDELAPAVHSWIACTPEAGRAMPAHVLAARLANHSGRPCRIADSIGEAMEIARDRAAANDLILVTGSFYTVGPALRWRTGRPGAKQGALGYTRAAATSHERL